MEIKQHSLTQPMDQRNKCEIKNYLEKKYNQTIKAITYMYLRV